MPKKNALASMTIWGLIGVIAATIEPVYATLVDPAQPVTAKLVAVAVVVSELLVLIGRWRKGDLTIGRAAALPTLVLVLAACATPQSDQAQGASHSEVRAPNFTPTIVVLVDGSGRLSEIANAAAEKGLPLVSITNSHSPSVTPSSTAQATAEQRADAKADVSASIPAEAVKTLAGVPAIPKVVKPAPAPVVEEVVPPPPAPAPAPAPVDPTE